MAAQWELSAFAVTPLSFGYNGSTLVSSLAFFHNCLGLPHSLTFLRSALLVLAIAFPTLIAIVPASSMRFLIICLFLRLSRCLMSGVMNLGSLLVTVTVRSGRIWLHCGWSWLQDTPESSTDGYLGPGYLALLHRVAFLCSAVSDTYCIGQRYRILHVSSPPDPTRSRSVQRRIPTEAD